MPRSVPATQQANAAMKLRRKSDQSSLVTSDARSSRKEDCRVVSSQRTATSALILIPVVTLALVAGWCHWVHVATMFESDRHFSHLSTLERELNFRTEMGFYYSFFKQMIEAPNYFTGMYSLIEDNITEYPDTISSFKRFNLYPELALSALYRFADHFHFISRQCWLVNRGAPLPSVESCEGSGEPAYFYVNAVFVLSGAMMTFFFLAGREVADGSMWGGVVAVVGYFANHRECTRVQWTPPLRESFSYPLFVLQQWLLIRILRGARLSGAKSAANDSDLPSSPPCSTAQLLTLAAATMAFMLPWQFAQFALLTQALALFAGHLFLLGPTVKTATANTTGQGSKLTAESRGAEAWRYLIRLILHSHLLALAGAFAMLLGNAMLLTSAYFAALVTMIAILRIEKDLLKWVTVMNRCAPVRWAIELTLLVVGTALVKQLLSSVSGVEDDAHIWDLLKSKLVANSHNFHTLLYTCAAEFDFMQMTSLWELTLTLLLPAACVAVIIATYHVVRLMTAARVKQLPAPSSGIDLVFLVCQLAAFTLMAVLIMRLKLFWTPQLCLTAALLARRDWWKRLRGAGTWWSAGDTVTSTPAADKRRSNWSHGVFDLRGTAMALLVAGMALRGWQNLQTEWAISGEFSDWNNEQLVNWIRNSTTRNESFAGSMPTMATIRLTTWRPIANHPHYEDTGLRRRTQLAYTIYSHKSVEEVWRIYRDQLKVTYAVVESGWCREEAQTNCTIPSVWDLEDPGNRGQPVLCGLVLWSPPGALQPFFREVFATESRQTVVLKVWDGQTP